VNTKYAAAQCGLGGRKFCADPGHECFPVAGASLFSSLLGPGYNRFMSSPLHAFARCAPGTTGLFWFGNLVSLAGTWMQDLALSWLVLSLTNSPVALGLYQWPSVFSSLAALLALRGVLADRARKRRAMIYCEACQLVVALLLAVFISTDVITVGIIYGLAAVPRMIDAVEGPMRQTFVPEMVGTEDLLNAIAPPTPPNSTRPASSGRQ